MFTYLLTVDVKHHVDLITVDVKHHVYLLTVDVKHHVYLLTVTLGFKRKQDKSIVAIEPSSKTGIQSVPFRGWLYLHFAGSVHKLPDP